MGELHRGERGGSWCALVGGCWPGEAANWNWGVLGDWLRGYVQLFLIVPKLEVGTNMREAYSY